MRLKRVLTVGVTLGVAASLMYIPASQAQTGSEYTKGNGAIRDVAQIAEYRAWVLSKKAQREAQEPLIAERIAFLRQQESADTRASRNNVSPRSGVVITACANRKTGVLRLAQVCLKTESKVSWNVQGPPGPGATAIVYEDVYDSDTLSANSYVWYNMKCSRGGTAINAGYGSDGDYFYATVSWQSNNGPDTWYLRVDNDADVSVEYTVTVYCML